MIRRTPRPFVLFTAIVTLAALVLGAHSLATYPIPFSIHLVLMLVAAVVAETVAVQLPRGGSQSLAYPLSLASVVLLGPTGAAVVSGASAISLQDIRQRTSPTLFIFNLSQILVSTTLSAYVYVQLGGLVLLQIRGGEVVANPLNASNFPAVLLPLIGLAISSFCLNAGLVGAATTLYRGIPLHVVWKQNISWLAPAQIALSFFGYAIAEVVAVSPFGFVLFIFPFVVSRQVFQGYLSLSSTYIDTVRALVATIEAKDRYTIGHSQRVATYAVALGRSLQMNEQQLGAVEYCALLHDLGKVGIDSSILNKPGPLTSEELAAVRDHPKTGESIAAHVPFLRDIAGIIRAHHERYDGLGYCDGLAGEAIPLEARVLAVADTFDAMTSARAYRRPCTVNEALQEIAKNSGTQFDPSVVAVADVLREVFVTSSQAEDVA